MPPSDVLLLERRPVRDLLRARHEARREEACGVLLGRATGPGQIVEAIAAVPNSSPTPRMQYDMAGPDLLPWFQDSGGLDVVGFYHSHPDAGAFPSRLDLELALPDWWYVVVGAGIAGEVEVAAWRNGRIAAIDLLQAGRIRLA